MTQTPAWTPDTILAAVHTWVQAHHGRLPFQRDLGPGNGLPPKHVVQTMFRTMHGLRRAYSARYGSREGLVTCPRCGQRWWSPDRYEQVKHLYVDFVEGRCRKPGQPRFAKRRRRQSDHSVVQQTEEGARADPVATEPGRRLAEALLDAVLPPAWQGTLLRTVVQAVRRAA
jgi:hypothetical protein